MLSTCWAINSSSTLFSLEWQKRIYLCKKTLIFTSFKTIYTSKNGPKSKYLWFFTDIEAIQMIKI